MLIAYVTLNILPIIAPILHALREKIERKNKIILTLNSIEMSLNRYPTSLIPLNNRQSLEAATMTYSYLIKPASRRPFHIGIKQNYP